MNQTLSDVYLNRAAAFLPNAPVSNDQMEAVLGMAGDVPSRVKNMILRSNAIKTRYYAIDPASRRATHTGSDLAAEAVRGLFAQGLAPESIGVLACGTSYADQILPGQGVMVHGLLPEIPPCEVLTAAGVCVAGMAAMKHAFNAVRTGEHAIAVAVASEIVSSVMRGENFRSEIDHKKLEHAKPDIGFEKDFLRWMLSDGGGAVQLSNRPLPGSLNFKIHWIEMLSYANEMPVCMYAGGEVDGQGRFTGWKSIPVAEREQRSVMAVKQDVKLLNADIIRYTVEKPLRTLIAKHGLQAGDITWFLPHYSSGFFRDKVAAGLDAAGLPIPQKQWFTNLHEKGNTGSASIYIILEEFMRTHPLEHGDKVLCYIPESGRFSTCFMLLEAVQA